MLWTKYSRKVVLALSSRGLVSWFKQSSGESMLVDSRWSNLCAVLWHYLTLSDTARVTHGVRGAQSTLSARQHWIQHSFCYTRGKTICEKISEICENPKMSGVRHPLPLVEVQSPCAGCGENIIDRFLLKVKHKKCSQCRNPVMSLLHSNTPTKTVTIKITWDITDYTVTQWHSEIPAKIKYKSLNQCTVNFQWK